MKFKKIMSLAMAAAMSLSLAAPAFAADSDQEQTLDVTGTTEAITVSVNIPTSAAVVVNPYRIEVTPAGASAPVQDQIIFARQVIKNAGNTPVEVSYTITGKAEGAAKFGTASFANDTKTTTNSVFMFFDIKAAEADAAALDADGMKTLLTGTYDKASKTQAVLSAKAVTKTAAVTIPAKKTNDGQAVFGLFGDAVKSPATAWKAEDKIGASIAFTFTPTALAVSGT